MEESRSAKKVVIVIDDDPVLLHLYRDMLKTHGVQAYLAKNGADGLKLISDVRPDCILLDIAMPEMTGVDLLKILRSDEKTRTTPVLILTNYETYRDQVKDFGVLDYMIKSNIDSRDVVRRVLDVLQKNAVTSSPPSS